MYCKNCGQQLEDDSKFCPSCGMKQDNSKLLSTVKPEDGKIIDISDGPIPESTPNKSIFKIIEIQLLIGWIAFHCLALLTSYGQVKGFNERGWYSAGIIWPFHTQWFWCNSHGASLLYSSGTCESNGGVLTFNGIFTAYDIADFLLYIGLSLFAILFVYMSRKNKF